MSDPAQSRAARGFAMMSALVARIAERRPPEEILQAVLAAVRSVLEADSVAIALLDAPGSSLTTRAATSADLVGKVFARNTLAWTVAAFGRAEAVPDLATDPRRGPLGTEPGFRRTLCAPFRAKDVARGVLIAGAATPGSAPTDSIDLALLVAFGEVAGHALVAEAERNAELRFHERLERLAAASHLRLEKRRDLDEALHGIARRKNVEIYEETTCDPLLPEVVLATRATAAFVAAAGDDGGFQVQDSFGLAGDEASAWRGSAETCRRMQAERRMSCVVSGADSGFPEHRQVICVRIPSTDGERVLHVLAAKERPAFTPEDVRCAEIVALQLAAVADRAALEAKLAIALGTDAPLVLEPLSGAAPVAADLTPAPAPMIGAVSVSDLLPAAG